MQIAAFDEWLLMERQRLRDRLRDALAMLIDCYMVVVIEVIRRALSRLNPRRVRWG